MKPAADLPGERCLRVLIVDDHAVVRQALRVMLEMEADMLVVAEAPDGEAAVALARTYSPDVVLMDIRMEGMDGVSATRELREQCPEVGVLILTAFGEDSNLTQAIQAGAHGFMLKESSQKEVIEAIRRVADGESLITPSLLRRLLDELAQRNDGMEVRHADLTERELEVLKSLAQGLSNNEIAKDLVISKKTVKTHLGHIFSKLDVESRAQAMLYAIREKIVEV